MEEQKKKQFSLSLMVKLFLCLIVVVSIGVFANSVMYYNQLHQEAEELTQALNRLYQTRTELAEMLGSAEELNALLSDYNQCRELLQSGTLEGELLDEYTQRLQEIRELLNRSDNKEYIARLAKDELDLYFADEKIFYNDMN